MVAASEALKDKIIQRKADEDTLLNILTKQWWAQGTYALWKA